LVSITIPAILGYQHVDYVKFIYEFSDRIFHVHMKDAYWSDVPMGIGVFGGHADFGDNRRYWNFRSLGRGKVNFENIIRALNDIGYAGPLSVEWEDSGMNREAGAAEACQFVKTSTLNHRMLLLMMPCRRRSNTWLLSSEIVV
jgi:sugar phosphate isomerase/epimerase